MSLTREVHKPGTEFRVEIDICGRTSGEKYSEKFLAATVKDQRSKRPSENALLLPPLISYPALEALQ